MKKLFLISIVLFLFFTSQSFGQIKFGPIVGLNIANISTVIGNVSSKSILGFHFGGIGEYAFNDLVSIESCVLIAKKGGVIDAATINLKRTISLYYLEIPVSGKFYIKTSIAKVFIIAGPYMGIGLSGTWKREGRLNDSFDVLWANNDNVMNNIVFRRFDLGLNVGTGIELMNFQVGVKYGFGLSNMIVPHSKTDINKVLGFSVAYLFSGK